MHNYTSGINFVIFSKIQDAGTSQELTEVMSAEDIQSQIIEAGFTKPVSSLSLSDKGEVVSTLLTFHLFIKVKAVMDQFGEGLERAGLLQYMKLYQDLMRPLFVNETPALTASKMIIKTYYNSVTGVSKPIQVISRQCLYAVILILDPVRGRQKSRYTYFLPISWMNVKVKKGHRFCKSGPQ